MRKKNHFHKKKIHVVLITEYHKQPILLTPNIQNTVYF